MNKIYPNKQKLTKRLIQLKKNIHKKSEELDKKAGEISLLEREAILVQRLIELSDAIDAKERTASLSKESC